MDLGIAGRRALIAGGTTGLGFETARALAAEGVRVAVGSRSEAKVEAARGRLPEGSFGLVADVSTPEGARDFVARGAAALGGIDILVANAGGPPPGNFASTDVEAYPEAIGLNLLSVVAMCKAAVPDMQARGWGRVLAITSISVRQPIAHLILSNTARAGATAFLKTLAGEVAGAGVTVNSLQPGLHATARLEALAGGDPSSLARGVPTGALGRPEDFGRVAAFLCSEHARFITGAAIPVDGGAYPGLQ